MIRLAQIGEDAAVELRFARRHPLSGPKVVATASTHVPEVSVPCLAAPTEMSAQLRGGRARVVKQSDHDFVFGLGQRSSPKGVDDPIQTVVEGEVARILQSRLPFSQRAMSPIIAPVGARGPSRCLRATQAL